MFIFCDAAENWQLNIQDPATPALEGMIDFHNSLLWYLIIIGVAVCWFLMKIIINFNENHNTKPNKFTHSNLLEVIWTILPAIVLIFISIPSFSLLYSLDELVDPAITLKIIGHQWFWSYEYSDNFYINNNLNVEAICFDSYMLQLNDLTKGSFRLLEVDNRTCLPTNTNIRFLIGSADVLHSWAVPSLGVKLDACPGRLSETSTFIKRPGTFYGQCSELCGINHGFMPIVIQSVSKLNFCLWRETQV